MVCTLIKHSSPPKKKRLHIVRTEKGFFGFFLLHYVMSLGYFADYCCSHVLNKLCTIIFFPNVTNKVEKK